ncbi:MAG TPA: S1C family serine protease [Acidimicrobiia bacterium]|nr:S1C family serine protease [Acidimicrobiia bacterium]
MAAPAHSPPRRRPRFVATAIAAAVAVAAVAVGIVSASDGDGVFADAEAATVAIRAEGDIAQPPAGSVRFGEGSGVVVSRSGLVVTAAHVVGAAGTVEATVDGREERVRGKVLGVSPCDGVAVVDLEGDGFTAIEWSERELADGDEIRATLPGDDVRLRTGSVLSASAPGGTEWTAVDRLLAHNLALPADRSGGPLLDDEGHVVGIVIAGRPGDASGIAVPADHAREVAARLRDEGRGSPFGLSGRGVAETDRHPAGLWVAAVAPDSAAAETGIRPGDVVTRVGDERLDETLAGACTVVDDDGGDDAGGGGLAVEVARPTNGRLLRGDLGGSGLRRAYSFTSSLPVEGSSRPRYRDFHTLTDDTGRLRVSVPERWDDVDRRPIDADASSRPSLAVAPDLDAFNQGYDTPGATVVVFDGFGPSDVDRLLDQVGGELQADCTRERRARYRTARLDGRFDVYRGCGGTSAVAHVVAAGPRSGGLLVLVAAQAVSDGDVRALDLLLERLEVEETDG